jgi:hypothetical protein
MVSVNTASRKANDGISEAVMKPFSLLVPAAALLLSAIAVCTPQPEPPSRELRFTVAKETTYITEPVGRDGSVDYVEALNRHYGKGVTPENNAAVPFLRAFGGKMIPKKARLEFYRRLGIDPLPEAGTYVSPDRWDEEFDRSIERPWTRADCPRVAKWLDANAATFALLDTAGRKPNWYFPLVCDEAERLLLYTGSTRLASVWNLSGCARLLQIRAYHSIAEGRIDHAIHILLTGHRLARRIERSGTVVASFWGDTVDGIMRGVAWNLVLSGKLTIQQSLAYRRQLEDLGPFRGVAKCFSVWERCYSLDTVQWFARSVAEKPSERWKSAEVLFLPNGARRLSGNFQDFFEADLVLRRLNQFFDRVRDVNPTMAPAQRRHAIRKLGELIQQFKDRGERVPWYVSRIGQTAMERHDASVWFAETYLADMEAIVASAITAEDRANTRYDLTRVALALAAYRAERGTYPARLPALVPRHIPALPVDRFSGKPLRYRLTKKAFLLYSVGENSRDDGGKQDDLAVGG